MTKQEFIDAIAKAANKYAPKYGIAVISPVIAQACLESAYGTTNKAKHNNFFGLKYRKDRLTCHSGYFKDGSKEQRADGTYYPVVDNWYAFDSLDSGVEGYFQYINVERYSNLKGVTDPYKYLELLRADGYATSLNYVKNVWAVVKSWNLTKYDKVEKEEATVGYTNSPLVSYTKLSPNHSGQRTHVIDRITPHCVVGQLTAAGICGCFTSSSVQASCNYGIGKDGDIGLCVEERNRSWCTSSNANDQRAVTIECASDKTHPYAFTSKCYNALVKLCVDICKRNGKTKLLWLGNKDKTLAYNPAANEMVLTVHRWFANKSCPGDWMYQRMGDLAAKVTAKLGGAAAEPEKKPDTTTNNFPAVPFIVNVKIDDLNYRSQPSMDGAVKGQTGKGVFTIVEVNNGWGKLKSGVGWIWLGNPQYCTIGDTVKTSTPTFSPYKVKVSIKDLNIRKGPGTNYASNGFCPVGVYTIIEESDGAGATKWGKLKSGAGWVSLDYAKRV